MNVIKIGRGIEIDIDCPVGERDHDTTLLHRIIGMLQHQQKTIETIRNKMVDKATLDASLAANTAAITNAINNIPSGNPASTPDTDVLAYVAGIDQNTAHLNAAENPVVPPPPIP